MKIIDTERRSWIPLRRVYLVFSVLVLGVTAFFLLDKGFWGIFAFCCVNAPLLFVTLVLKDDPLKRLQDTLADLSDILRPFS